MDALAHETSGELEHVRGRSMETLRPGRAWEKTGELCLGAALRSAREETEDA
jgi:hypothetical protein